MPLKLKFTKRGDEVMRLANQEAKRLHHEYIGTEHILLGLLKEKPSIAAAILDALQVNPEAVLVEIEKLLVAGPEMVQGTLPLPKTPRAKQALELAEQEAVRMGCRYLGVEHLLLGVVRVGHDCSAGALLNAVGCSAERIREAYSQKEFAAAIERSQRDFLEARAANAEKPITAEQIGASLGLAINHIPFNATDPLLHVLYRLHKNAAGLAAAMSGSTEGIHGSTINELRAEVATLKMRLKQVGELYDQRIKCVGSIDTENGWLRKELCLPIVPFPGLGVEARTVKEVYVCQGADHRGIHVKMEPVEADLIEILENLGWEFIPEGQPSKLAQQPPPQ